jgi:hypothetical protein
MLVDGTDDGPLKEEMLARKSDAARNARVPEIDSTFAEATAKTARAFPQRLKLVLHAGTPKTGTKALQQTLYENIDALSQLGVWYPPARLDPEMKKHQFLIGLLLYGDGAGLAQAFDEIVHSAPPQTRTVVLSTEGLFNHWWDFAPESKAMLRHLASLVDLELWACFREPVAFAITQHAQLLQNPRQFAPAYGLDIGLEEILENGWFAQRLDYLGFVFEAEELLGAGNVRAFKYGPDIVDRIFRAIGASASGSSKKLVNPSMRQPGVDLMRIVNRYDLPPAEKYDAAALVLALDTLIGERAEPLRASPQATRRIHQLAGREWQVMERMLE